MSGQIRNRAKTVRMPMVTIAQKSNCGLRLLIANHILEKALFHIRRKDVDLIGIGAEGEVVVRLIQRLRMAKILGKFNAGLVGHAHAVGEMQETVAVTAQ